MANTATLSGNINVAGLGMTLSNTQTAEGAISQVFTAPMAYAGTLSTRVDDDNGTVTASGHNIIETDEVDIYWTGGVAYGGTAGVISGNDIPVTTLDAAGDALPVQDTAVIIAKRTEAAVLFDAAQLKFYAAYSESRGHFVAETAVPATTLAQELTAGESMFWMDGQSWTNPFSTDDVATVTYSTADITADTDIKMGFIIDSA